MTSVSATDANAQEVLRTELQALEGVERAIIDDQITSVWLHCEPEADETVLRARALEVLKKAGVEDRNAKLVLLTDLSARRIRFTKIERTIERDGRVKMRVTLEWEGQAKVGEASGEHGDMTEQRAAATAALFALEAVVGHSLDAKLVGVKHVRAFDEELMVVALYRKGPPAQRLVGSVSIDADPRRAAAIAVLNGLNRILGSYLNVR